MSKIVLENQFGMKNNYFIQVNKKINYDMRNI